MTDTKRKAPVRKCSICAQRLDKRDLIRIVRTPEGEVKIDQTGKMNGRGAYICKGEACLKKARKQRRIDASLGVSVPGEIYEQIRGSITDENSK